LITARFRHFSVLFRDRLTVPLYPAEPLTEEEQAQMTYLEDSFPDWSRRDFQQLVRTLEANGWTDDYVLLVTDIQEKTLKEAKKYFLVFKKWKQLAGNFL